MRFCHQLGLCTVLVWLACAALGQTPVNSQKVGKAKQVGAWPGSNGAGEDKRTELSGHRTVRGAKLSSRPCPIPVRYVYGEDRDWIRQPYRLGVVLIDMRDTKHAPAHTASWAEQMLFARDQYHVTPGGEASFGSVADWLDAQSLGRFRFTGRVFDWVTVDLAFAEIEALSHKEGRERFLQAAMAEVRARDGQQCLEDFDGLFFMHAGPIGKNILWSHRADIDGRRYITTFEMDRINVICHEFGHVLGLPDLYAKKGLRETFGPWCAMASGYRGKYPGSFCVWSKARIGWSRPTVIDAARQQKLVLRPIQEHPDDALLIPLNRKDGIGAEFLMLENRAAKGNDAERQAGLLIWRVTRDPDSNGFPSFTLTLPGPDDGATDQQRDRIVAWPGAKADRFVAKSELTAVLSHIRREGELVFFEVGPK